MTGRMLLITFSGVDGSGKTTHAEQTAAFLRACGFRVRILRPAHLSLGAAWTRARRMIERPDTSSRTKLPGEDPTPTAAARESRGASVKGWLVYPLDAVWLRLYVLALRVRGCTALVCDRYIYDQLANLRRADGALARILLWLAPTPDLPVLLDVGPETARNRKPEHAVDYYTQRHDAYLRLSDLLPPLMRVRSSGILQTQRRLEAIIADRFTAGSNCDSDTRHRSPAAASTG